MTRAEKARELFKSGYACSQAVALAFSDLTTLSEEEITKAALPFGGGLGRLRLTCGAVSGMAMVAGLILSKNENTSENKLATYEMVRELCAQFEKEFGSLICADLLSGSNVEVIVGGKPDERNTEYYKKRPCDEIVFIAAEILEKYLQNRGIL